MANEYVHGCEICADLSSPAAAAELWYLAHDTYGRQTDSGYAKAPMGGAGAASALYRRTEPFAPLGKTGRTMFRRVYVILSYQFGGCQVRVRSIVDFTRPGPSITRTYPDPQTQSRYRVEVELPMAIPGTWIEVVVELLTWTGRIEVLGIDAAHRPITQAASSVVGVES